MATAARPPGRGTRVPKWDYLLRTTDEIFTKPELDDRIAAGRPLRIKYGVDVTAPFLHIGHAVNLWMMRHLQERGHVVVFLIGDFTTRIGDPTGKSEVRPQITRDDIDENSERFIEQVAQILLTDPGVFEIRRNSEWYDEMGVDEFLRLLAMVTHGRLVQRDMFQERINAGREIYMHELLYPLLQGYDSVMLQSDLTIVGTDQLFNELMGRFYQERLGQRPQVVMTTKITPGTDGKQKQSKSLGNYIALADPPREKYGKAMSIPDELIAMFMEVYTEIPRQDVADVASGIEDGSINPKAAKAQLAKSLVERYHGPQAAAEEATWFDRVFSRAEQPDDVPVIAVPPEATVLDALSLAVPGESRSHLRRLVAQGAVRAGEDRLLDHDAVLGELPVTLRIGRRTWVRLVRQDNAMDD